MTDEINDTTERAAPASFGPRSKRDRRVCTRGRNSGSGSGLEYEMVTVRELKDYPRAIRNSGVEDQLLLRPGATQKLRWP